MQTIRVFGIWLYHWFIRNSGIGVATNIPKSSLPTVFHGLASFENYHGHENSKGPEVTKFSTHPRDPRCCGIYQGASGISNHIRSMEYIFFSSSFQTADT